MAIYDLGAPRIRNSAAGPGSTFWQRSKEHLEPTFGIANVSFFLILLDLGVIFDKFSLKESFSNKEEIKKKIAFSPSRRLKTHFPLNVK